MNEQTKRMLEYERSKFSQLCDLAVEKGVSVEETEQLKDHVDGYVSQAVQPRIGIQERIESLRDPWPNLIERLTDATEIGTSSGTIGLTTDENRDAFPDDIHMYEGVMHQIAGMLSEYFNMPKSKFNFKHTMGNVEVDGENYAGSLDYQRKK